MTSGAAAHGTDVAGTAGSGAPDASRTPDAGEADPSAPRLPRVLTAIISYDAPHLTQRAYDAVVANAGTHVVVLDHSSREDLVFRSPHTVDLGRDVKTYGECLDIILGDPQLRAYDFVGIWCNDVFDVADDAIARLFSAVAYAERPVGIVAHAIAGQGSPHAHMRRLGSGLREVPFVETIAPFVNTELFPVLERFVPTPSMGWGPDVVIAGIARALGYGVCVFDDAEVGHVINGGTFKELGQLSDHALRAPREAAEWIGRHHLWPLVEWTSLPVARQLAQSVAG